MGGQITARGPTVTIKSERKKKSNLNMTFFLPTEHYKSLPSA